MLAKRYRLRKDFQFRYVYKNGSFVRTPAINLVYVKARHKSIRLGISVSNKIGKAVARNRIKRRIRECVAALLPSLKTGFNYILVANNGYDFHNCDYSAICGFIKQTFVKSGLIAAAPPVTE